MATDTEDSPWHVVHSEDKMQARLNCINHLLSQIAYEEVPGEPVELPARQKPKGYVEPNYPFKVIPGLF